MNSKILKTVATDKRLTGMHMRICILLSLGKPLMQAQLAEILSVKKQNINKITKELEIWGYIKIQSVEGKNKYLTISNDVNKINSILIGQQSLL